MRQKTNRAVIIGAATIINYKKIASYLNPLQDFFIYCDGGLYHQGELENHCCHSLKPNLAVGDFDSHPAPQGADYPIIQLPREKDDTDTWFAVKEAIGRGFTQFLLLGVVGQRLDHSMANLSILLHLHELGFSSLLVDDYSEMEVVGQKSALVSCDFSYFSLLNIDGTAKNVTITNAHYPLDRAELKASYQYAISNKVLPNKIAKITVESGCLLLTRVF